MNSLTASPEVREQPLASDRGLRGIVRFYSYLSGLLFLLAIVIPLESIQPEFVVQEFGAVVGWLCLWLAPVCDLFMERPLNRAHFVPLIVGALLALAAITAVGALGVSDRKEWGRLLIVIVAFANAAAMFWPGTGLARLVMVFPLTVPVLIVHLWTGFYLLTGERQRAFQT